MVFIHKAKLNHISEICNNLLILLAFNRSYHALHHLLGSDTRQATVIPIAAVALTIDGARTAVHVELDIDA